MGQGQGNLPAESSWAAHPAGVWNLCGGPQMHTPLASQDSSPSGPKVEDSLTSHCLGKVGEDPGGPQVCLVLQGSRCNCSQLPSP